MKKQNGVTIGADRKDVARSCIYSNKYNIWEGNLMRKLWCYLVLATILFAFGCEQPNNDEKGKTTPSNKITITVNGDEGITVKTPNTFKIEKGSTWQNIKQKAIDKVTEKENKEIQEWRVKDANGEVIADTRVFNEDSVVWAVSKDKKITITVNGDEGITVKTPNTFKIEKGSTWQNIKQKAIDKVTEKENKEIQEWRIQDANGEVIADTRVFNEDSVVWAVSKDKKTNHKLKIEGDERVKVDATDYIEVPIGTLKTIGDVRADIEAKLSLADGWSNENYGVYDWRVGEETGEEITDSMQITDDIVVYVRTNYKKFKVEGATLKGYEGEKPRGRIFLPKDIKEIHKASFTNCIGITAIDFSPCTQLEKILPTAFKGCSNIKSLNFAGCSKLVSFAYATFEDCIGLVELDLSPCTSLKNIRDYAFRHCSSLKNVNLTGCVEITNVMRNAFENCTSLENIDLSPCTKLKTIEERSLSGCSKAVVRLPASVTKIERVAFGQTFTSCKEVQVPEAATALKDLVKNSGYPEDRIKTY